MDFPPDEMRKPLHHKKDNAFREDRTYMLVLPPESSWPIPSSVLLTDRPIALNENVAAESYKHRDTEANEIW